MSGVFRTLLDRLATRLRGRAPEAVEPTMAPDRIDIVLSELPRDWAESLETADPSTDYDVRSLGEPIEPASRQR